MSVIGAVLKITKLLQKLRNLNYYVEQIVRLRVEILKLIKLTSSKNSRLLFSSMEGSKPCSARICQYLAKSNFDWLLYNKRNYSMTEISWIKIKLLDLLRLSITRIIHWFYSDMKSLLATLGYGFYATIPKQFFYESRLSIGGLSKSNFVLKFWTCNLKWSKDLDISQESTEILSR